MPDPEPLLGVRLGGDRRGHGRAPAEPGRVLLARPGSREPTGATQADRAHADPVHVSGGRPPAPGLRHDGRRGAAADAGGARHADGRSGPRPSGGGRSSALALRAHVGRGDAVAQAGGAVR